MNTAADANMIQHKSANAKSTRVFKCAALVLAATILSACGGGGGHGGSSNHSAPNVSASVIGQGSASAGNIYTVRSGSEVLLSGKDSEGTDAPILSFTWRQISPTAADQQIALTERTTSSKIFTAPAVATATTYVFELTGTDANGKSSTQQVSVKVEPILDSNLFLIQPGDKEQLNILVKRVTPCSGNSCANAVPFTLKLSQVATWADRADINVTRGPYALPLKTITNRQIDVGQQSTIISIPLPKLIIDDINRNLESANLRDQRIELDRVASIKAALEFALTPGTSENISLDLVKDDKTTLVNANTSSLTDPNAASAAFAVAYDLTDIRDKLGISSATTGAAYYNAIDPTAKYAQLSAWLFDAGFTDASGKLKSDPSITKAIYTNNFDLGFGREMYLRKDGNGNVFTYVINYPSLENAIQGSNAFAVVAMEYSGYPNNTTPAGCARSKFVKFYAYVPDQTNGGFVRASTMNFDGRGEKAVPGVCASCHGGSLTVPHNSTTNAIDFAGTTASCSNADIAATFMPWDMDSFLYTDTDPSLNRTNITDAQYAQYTRSAQENSLRALNEGALATYVDNPSRYDASIRLIHGWYGEKDSDNGSAATYAAVDSLPAVKFDGSYVQSGWRSQPALYQNVFARHCRGCHTQRDPGQLTDTPYPAKKVFSSYADFISYAGTDGSTLRDYIFEQGIMPDARLTMDRFWISTDGNPLHSPAEILRAHLSANGVNITTTPGNPIAHFTITPTTTNYLSSLITLDASSSLFADSYLWSVAPSSGLSLSGTQNQAELATPSITGSYNVQLTISGPQGSNSITQPVVIANRLPVAPNLTVTIPDGNTSVSIDVSNSGAFNSAGGSLGDGLGAPQGSVNWTSTSSAPETLSAANNVLSYANSGSSSTDINSTFGYSITDANGDTATGTIRITRSSRAPSNLAVTARATTSISLAWTAASSAQVTGYQVYRTVSSVESPAGSALSAATTSFNDTGLTSNTPYSYRVVSLVAGVPQLYSNTAIANTKVSYVNDIMPNYNGSWTCTSCHGDSASSGVSNIHLFNVALPDCLIATPSCNTAMNGAFNSSSPEYQLIHTWYTDYNGSPANNE